jgi:hypothetical protein
MGYKPQERESGSDRVECSSAEAKGAFVRAIPGGNVLHTDNLPEWLQAEFEKISNGTVN